MQKYLKDVNNLAVLDSLVKAKSVLRRHFNIAVSISGGSDSDIVLDIVEKQKGNKHVEYIWFDTGIEYQATKDHLKFLEEKYGIEIKRIKAIKPIPTCCREFGVPFLSKNVSEMLSRLQKNNFKFEDKPEEQLISEYPNCKSAIRWWCNTAGKINQFNIAYNKHLKEFLIQNPPPLIYLISAAHTPKRNQQKNLYKKAGQT